MPSVSILKSAVSGSPSPECILKALVSLVSIPTVQVLVLLTFKLKTTSPSDLSNVKLSDCKLPGWIVKASLNSVDELAALFFK